MSGPAPSEARELALAWMIVRTDPRTAEWRRSMPRALRVALERFVEAYQDGRLASGRR